MIMIGGLLLLGGMIGLGVLFRGMRKRRSPYRTGAKAPYRAPDAQLHR
ncbi:MAG TPA: hypothetical protein VFQ34_13230 [Nitrospiraceae bacterium]|jgi:hypothetical protein|nr:hypothetical protein [Nitrospiraceae bacterium]